MIAESCTLFCSFPTRELISQGHSGGLRSVDHVTLRKFVVTHEIIGQTTLVALRSVRISVTVEYLNT